MLNGLTTVRTAILRILQTKIEKGDPRHKRVPKGNPNSQKGPLGDPGTLKGTHFVTVLCLAIAFYVK